MSTFADFLRTWRTRRGLLQADVAEWIEVPYRTYTNWEQRRAEPSSEGPIRKLLALYDELHDKSGQRIQIQAMRPTKQD